MNNREKKVYSVSAYPADHARIKEIMKEQKLETIHDTVAFLVKQHDIMHGVVPK